jgi:hypothetical protein
VADAVVAGNPRTICSTRSPAVQAPPCSAPASSASPARPWTARGTARSSSS